MPPAVEAMKAHETADRAHHRGLRQLGRRRHPGRPQDLHRARRLRRLRHHGAHGAEYRRACRRSRRAAGVHRPPDRQPCCPISPSAPPRRACSPTAQTVEAVADALGRYNLSAARRRSGDGGHERRRAARRRRGRRRAPPADAAGRHRDAQPAGGRAAARRARRQDAKPRAKDQARRLVALGARAVLVKGGHGDWARGRRHPRHGVVGAAPRTPRIETRNTHGTGCTLSAAIAALLARGAPLKHAVRAAKQFTWQAIAAAKGSKNRSWRRTRRPPARHPQIVKIQPFRAPA